MNSVSPQIEMLNLQLSTRFQVKWSSGSIYVTYIVRESKEYCDFIFYTQIRILMSSYHIHFVGGRLWNRPTLKWAEFKMGQVVHKTQYSTDDSSINTNSYITRMCPRFWLAKRRNTSPVKYSITLSLLIITHYGCRNNERFTVKFAIIIPLKITCHVRIGITPSQTMVYAEFFPWF